MKLERIIFNISTYGALAVVLAILVFPAVTALAQAYSNGALSSPPVSGIGLFNFWSHVLLDSDSGAMMSMGRGALSMLIFLASLLWLSVSRLRSRYGLLVGGALAFLLIWNGLSAYFSVCFYESLLDVVSYASIAALFFLVASLIREFALREPGQKAASTLDNAERVADFGLSFLQIVAFLVMVGAWSLHFSNPASDGISGSFYNKNILAAFLLLLMPCGLLRLAKACRQWEDPKNNNASLKVGLQALFVVLATSLIILTYSRACLLLLCLVLAFGVALFAYSSAPKITWPLALLGSGIITILLWVAVLLWTRLWAWALVCIVVALALAYIKFLKGRSGGSTLAVVLAISCLAVWGIVSLVQADTMATQGKQHLQALGSSRDSSLASRYQFYKASLKMALAHPLLGVGAGNFERFYPAFQTDFRWFSKRSHSLSCDLLAEGGVVSFVTFYLLIAFLFREVFRKMATDSPQLWNVRLSCLLGASLLLVHSQIDVDNHVFILPVWAVTLLALAWGLPDKAECESNSCTYGWSAGQRYFISFNCLPVIALVALFCLAGQAWGGQYYSTIGKIYLDMGEAQKARQCYSWASEYDPKIGEYWRQMAVLTLGQCDNEERAKALSQSIRFCAIQAAATDPHRASVQSILGQALELSGDLKQAELSYRRSLELDSQNSPEAYANLARVCVRQGRIKEAQAVLDRSLTVFTEDLLLNSDFFDFRYQDIKNQLISCCWQGFELAFLENNKNSGRDAEKYLLKACRLDPSLSNNLKEAAVYLLEQGRQLKSTGHKEKAQTTFSKAECLLVAAKAFKPEDPEIRDLLRLLEKP